MSDDNRRQASAPQPANFMSVQCVHCGWITTASLEAVVECPGCARLCFRIVDLDAPGANSTAARRPSSSDNSAIVERVTSLVKRILDGSGQ